MGEFNSKVEVDKIPLWYIERVVNKTLPGLQLYARDVDIPEALAEKYVPGRILLDKGFIDATCRVGGLEKPYRLSILSNKMANVSEMIAGSEEADDEVISWGLCVAKHGSRFKVLDKFEYNGKCQILLLHLPDTEDWRIFEDVEINVLDEIAKDCRARFVDKLEERAIPEVNTERWYERLQYPLGFNEDFEPWPLEEPLQERLRPMKEINFRDIDGCVFYIKDAIPLLRMDEVPDLCIDDIAQGFNDAIVWGYIDEEGGLSLWMLCAAKENDGVIETTDAYVDMMLLFRYGSVEELLGAQLVDSILFKYANKIAEVQEDYESNESLQDTRELDFLDELRHQHYPDDIRVVLFTQNKVEYYEIVWMRLRKIEGDTIFARLLNEPTQPTYGVHVGQIMPLTFHQKEDGLAAFALADEAL